MTKTIFRSTFAVGISILLLCALLFFGLQYRRAKDETYAAMQREAVYAERGLRSGGADYLRQLGSYNRITWIAADGTVLYDSLDADDLQNQGDCPEVRAALANGEGKDTRRHDSRGESTIYCALRCEDGSVLRLGRPLGAVRDALIAVSPVLWVVVLVVMISGMLAFRAAKQIVEPINAIDLDAPQADIYPELSPLIARLQTQTLTIQEQIAELKGKQQEFSALTDCMSEGFLLLDREAVVLIINETAKRILPEAAVDLPLALPEPLNAALQSALREQHAEAMFASEGQNWEFIANPVKVHGQPSGAVLLLVNVTERVQREHLRQEFSANVSHELRTPLTSISGFAELMTQGMVPPEKSQEFASDIYREARRLIALVDDIINLSKLDEGGITAEWVPVDLHTVAADVLESLRPAAEKQQITLELAGESVLVRGVYRLIQETVFNLCDNAVKYNRVGGSVAVLIAGGAQTAQITVSDTGIGIPYADRNRVFERFYRVDKSHSKEIGGTGLGLSIVKHAMQFHHGSIALESEPNVGTSVILSFPVDS